MTYENLLSELTNNPQALLKYTRLIRKMLENGATITSTSKNEQKNLFEMETLFSNDSQIYICMTEKEIEILKYSNVSDEFGISLDNFWIFQRK